MTDASLPLSMTQGGMVPHRSVGGRLPPLQNRRSVGVGADILIGPAIRAPQTEKCCKQPSAALLPQMTEILHAPASSTCNSMQLMYKYSFTHGNRPLSDSTGFCGNVDNCLWTIFRPFSPVWKSSHFVHRPCGRAGPALPRASAFFPQYFILRVLFLSFILSSPQKRAEHERKGTHPHEIFL